MPKRPGSTPLRRRGSVREKPNAVETTVFRSGNSDAVRLPKGFAVAGQRVRLRRLTGGRTLIEPARPRRWPKGFLESFGRVSADFKAPPRPSADPAEEIRAARIFDAAPE